MRTFMRRLVCVVVALTIAANPMVYRVLVMTPYCLHPVRACVVRIHIDTLRAMCTTARARICRRRLWYISPTRTTQPRHLGAKCFTTLAPMERPQRCWGQAWPQ